MERACECDCQQGKANLSISIFVFQTVVELFIYVLIALVDLFIFDSFAIKQISLQCNMNTCSLKSFVINKQYSYLKNKHNLKI